jgi:nucleotide-binding universal stress UspA family protein
MKSNAMDMLEERKQKYKKSSVSIRTHVLIGSPVDKIIEFADDKNLDLIIMGSRGLRGISRLIKGLGSVSRNVSEKVKCTIMIVR